MDPGARTLVDILTSSYASSLPSLTGLWTSEGTGGCYEINGTLAYELHFLFHGALLTGAKDAMHYRELFVLVILLSGSIASGERLLE